MRKISHVLNKWAFSIHTKEMGGEERAVEDIWRVLKRVLCWQRILKDFRLPMGCDWRRHWHPTPVLLPGKSHGRRSLVGSSPWGR